MGAEEGKVGNEIGYWKGYSILNWARKDYVHAEGDYCVGESCTLSSRRGFPRYFAPAQKPQNHEFKKLLLLVSRKKKNGG